MPSDKPVDLAALQTLLTTVVAPWVSELKLRVLAAADAAMILAIVSQTGAFKPMTTVLCRPASCGRSLASPTPTAAKPA